VAAAARAAVLPAPPSTAPARIHREAPASRLVWPQFGFDAEHSGRNPFESAIGPETVSKLRVRFRIALPAVADGAPAYLAGVPTSAGPRNLLFATTKEGQLVAVDAESGGIAWAADFPAGPRYTTSSPAIDPSRAFVYSYGLDGFVHRFLASDGEEVAGDGWPELATRKPGVEKGSSALALATDRVERTFLYVANGGYPGDQCDYQGHVTAVDLATGAQRVFNAACSSLAIHFDESGSAVTDCAQVQTAIWARAGAVYVADTDRTYVATGNGRFDGAANWGDSVLALSPDAVGLLDSYTPPEFDHLDKADADLGSSIVAPFRPSTGETLGVQVGKDGVLRVLRLADMSGAGRPGTTGGELQKLGAPGGTEVLTAPATSPDPTGGEPWVFVANGSGIAGYQWDPGSAGLVVRWTNSPGGTSPVTAGGLLFVASPGRLRALDPSTGETLWSGAGIGGIHWQSPIVIGGRLYVEDESGFLTAYSVDGF
jgi:outer membrane protein assembly factor BamB